MNYQEKLYQGINNISRPIIMMIGGEIEVNINGCQIPISDYLIDSKQGFVKNPSNIKFYYNFPMDKKRELQQKLNKIEKKLKNE